MLVVFIAIGAGSSVLLAEACNQPVPETALLEVLQEDNMVTGKPVIKPEDFDAETLGFYLACNGTNKVEDQVVMATTGLQQLEKSLQSIDKCDSADMQAVIPGATRSIGAVQTAVGCPRINFLLLRFTRQGVCHHMVDGLFFLWTVQAACGAFLLLALTMMRVVTQTYHEVGADKAGGAATPAPATPADGQRRRSRASPSVSEVQMSVVMQQAQESTA